MEGQSNSNIQLPPGFRFHPSDEELIVHYLRNKVTSNPVPASIIAEVDLYKHDPWELPKKALFGDNEWYFFSPRDRKYPNGERPNRAAASGYWKATGTDKPILTSCRLQSVGVKKALVFYMGRPPKGTKTNWIMQEYRLPDNMVRPSRLRGSMRLDDWVLCRVRQKDNTLRNMWEDQNISNTQPFGYSPVIEEQSSMNIDPTLDAYENYLKNGCPLLAWILASQNNPRIETTSFLSFQGGNNSNNGNSVHEENISDLGSSLITDSSINSSFNPLKRKPFESHLEYESLLPLNKKLVNNSNKLPNTTTELSFCRQYPDYNMFNPYPSNPNIEFQDLNKFKDEVLERRL